MIICSIHVDYAIDRESSWRETVTGRSINGFDLPGSYLSSDACSSWLSFAGLGRLPGDREAGVALVQNVTGGQVGVWGSDGQDS